MVSRGLNERLNTVPLPPVPPEYVVPYRVLLDKIKPPYGLAPSLPPVKLYRFVKPVPSVLTANNVPMPRLPPRFAIPYRVLPDKVNPANGLAPSLLPKKLCRTVNPVPLVLTANTVPLPELPRPLPPSYVVPYKVLPDKINGARRGQPPSLPPVNVYRVVKLVPSVLRANTVPQPELPPQAVVPYRVLPDKVKPLVEAAPSLLV